MSRSVEQLVTSQMLFREVNERLRETVGAFEGPLEFLCECSNEDCIEKVGLDIKEYERIRSHPNLFLVASGHERLEVDHVVDQGIGYILVEKVVGAEKVIAADPRSRGG
jgi:hypothetical protein